MFDLHCVHYDPVADSPDVKFAELTGKSNEFTATRSTFVKMRTQTLRQSHHNILLNDEMLMNEELE